MSRLCCWLDPRRRTASRYRDGFDQGAGSLRAPAGGREDGDLSLDDASFNRGRKYAAIVGAHGLCRRQSGGGDQVIGQRLSTDRGSRNRCRDISESVGATIMDLNSLKLAQSARDCVASSSNPLPKPCYLASRPSPFDTSDAGSSQSRQIALPWLSNSLLLNRLSLKHNRMMCSEGIGIAPTVLKRNSKMKNNPNSSYCLIL